MPSSSTAVILVLIYWRTGAPWTGASVGIVKPVSGCTEAALELVFSPSPPLGLELRIGVLTRAGTGVGEGALLAVSGVAAEAMGADDCFGGLVLCMGDVDKEQGKAGAGWSEILSGEGGEARDNLREREVRDSDELGVEVCLLFLFAE